MSRTDRQEFFEEHGTEGPYECFFCGDDVEANEVVVRHEDTFDEDNDRLVAAHRKCHNENTSI